MLNGHLTAGDYTWQFYFGTMYPMENIKIYVYGCSTCGSTSAYIRRAKRYADSIGREIEIANSKHDTRARVEHGELLRDNIRTDSYEPIVYDLDNGKVVRLKDYGA